MQIKLWDKHAEGGIKNFIMTSDSKKVSIQGRSCQGKLVEAQALKSFHKNSPAKTFWFAQKGNRL